MFVSILECDGLLTPIFDGTTGLIVTIPIAKGVHCGRIVSLTSGMADCVVDGLDASEFYFQFDVYDLDDTYEPFSTQDRSIAYQFVPDQIRSKIIGLVCRSLDALVQAQNPPRLYWVAKEAGLPAKALKKYHILAGAAEDLGYVISDHGSDPCGRSYWKMDKLSIDQI